jgi:hypothetical protein
VLTSGCETGESQSNGFTSPNGLAQALKGVGGSDY